MAALQSIRNHPWVMTTVLGGGLILMIIMFGFDDYSGFINKTPDVMEVNGNGVSRLDYENVRERKSNFYESFYNQDVNKAEASHQINNEVFNEFAQDIMLGSEYDEMGIGVSSEEINQLVHGNHISPVMTQIFGQQAQQLGATFAELVANNNFESFAMQYNAPWATMSNWLEIEAQIVRARKSQKLNALLATAIKPNKLEAEDAFNNENSEVAFTYVRKRASEVADSLINISTSDIKKYYDARKDMFKMSQKSRTVAYIAVPIRPSQADCDNTLANIEKNNEQFTAGTDIEELINNNSSVAYVDAYLNNNIFRGELKEFVEAGVAGAVKNPSIYSGDILALLGERSENDETLSEYYWTARIMGKVKAADSVKVILTAITPETTDSINKAMKDGKMDDQAQWLTDAATIQFDNSIREKLFATQVGKTFTTTFNNGQADITVLGKVLEATAPVEKSKVAIYAEKINPSSKTRRTMYGELRDFTLAFPTIAAMQDSALNNGYRMADATVYTNSYSINEVKECRQAVRFAFDEPTGKVSEIYEENGYLLVVANKGEIQEDYASYNDPQVADYIKSQIIAEKKVAYLMANDFKGLEGKSVEEVAQALGSDVQSASRVSLSTNSVSGLGVEPEVIAKAVKAEAGTVVGPIAGKNNVVVLQVTEKTNKELTYDEASYLNKVASTSVYRSASSAANSVINREAEVVDNRIVFY